MVPAINFRLLFKACKFTNKKVLEVILRVKLTVILKILKELIQPASSVSTQTSSKKYDQSYAVKCNW